MITQSKSKNFLQLYQQKLKLKSVITAMLDDIGSICIKDIEKTNGFMYFFKELFTVDKGQLTVECD